MAKKKTARSSNKKSSTSNTSSKSKKAKPKATTTTKKTAAAKSKAKAKGKSVKKITTSKVTPKSAAKTKPKTAQATQKPASPKKTQKKSSPSSTKKTPTTQSTKVARTKKVRSKPQAKPSTKRTRKIPKRPSVKTHTTPLSTRAATASRSPKPQTTKKDGLSASERYNIGGLFACAIDQARDPGLWKLKKALKHLALTTQEQENLVRLTQGFMIPKLFADEIQDEETRKLAVKELVGFAKTEGNYERDWQSDLEQFGIWLGISI